MSREAIKFRNSVSFVVSFTILLWVVKALEWAVELDFGFLGILPRTLSGTMGIFTAPLIHGDVLHLISNTFPLLLLGVSVFYFYDRIALEVFAWIYFMSGFWVWMAARDAYHIGASGLVYGLVAFLFFSGLFRRDTKSLSISLIVIFLYGGMLQGLFPTDGRISWESHLLGALAGAFCAFFYRDVRLHEKGASASLEEAYGQGQTVVQSSSLFPILKREHEKEPGGNQGKSSYADYQKAIDTYPLEQIKQEDASTVIRSRIINSKSPVLGLYVYVVFPSPSTKEKQEKSLYRYPGPKNVSRWEFTPSRS